MANHKASPPYSQRFNERFWNRVNKDGPVPDHRPELGHCWVWTGASKGRTGSGGYGLVFARVAGRRVWLRAHRVAWTIVHGAPDEGIEVLHKCDNRSCVNPAHLFLGTQADNMHDMLTKGRHYSQAGITLKHRSRGSARHGSKLKESDIVAIRDQAEHKTLTSIATEFGVCRQTVSDIVSRKTWDHVGSANG